MKKVRIFPAHLNGIVHVPSSKSIGHREIICAGLAKGLSIIDNISMSKDIEATCRCLTALGVRIEKTVSRFSGRTALKIMGTGNLYPHRQFADCGESGSTLRFLIPLGALLGQPFTFLGHGNLVNRPLEAYYRIFEQQNLQYKTDNNILPLTVNGQLKAGHFILPGNVSSQYVTGLLFALPLLKEDSVIEITSPLESSAYVDLTLSCLKKYGIVVENQQHRIYKVKGNQQYRPQNSVVEGDWSQAAFWLAGGALGQKVQLEGMDTSSLQGDKAVIGILKAMNCNIITEKCLQSIYSSPKGTVIDASACPDIIPVLTALAAVSSGKTEIINAARLRFKECDRLAAITSELNKLGSKVTELPDGLIIEGCNELIPQCELDAWNDHRIAMSLAVIAGRCIQPFILNGADSVEKSYPGFWKDYQQIGGKIEVLA